MPSRDEYESLGHLLWLLCSTTRVGDWVRIWKTKEGYTITGKPRGERTIIVNAVAPKPGLEAYLRRLYGQRRRHELRRSGDPKDEDHTRERC